jgi:hypothetical protein
MMIRMCEREIERLHKIVQEIFKVEVVIRCRLKKYCRDYCLKNCYNCRYLDCIYLKKVKE